MEQKAICIYCGDKAEMMCQRCYENYCTVNCQIADWATHKLICTPLPKLIPLQPINKLKKTSVNARLDRSNFRNDSNNANSSMPSLRRFSSNPSNNNIDKNTDDFRKSDRNLHRSVNQNFSDNRSPRGMGLRNNKYEHSDKTSIKSADDENKQNYASVEHKKNLPPGHNKPFGELNPSALMEQIDFTLKAKNQSNEDNTNSVSSNHVSLKSEASSNAALNLSVSSTSSKVSSIKKPWRSPFPLPEDKFFTVIVQYVSTETSSLVWVTMSSLEEGCDTLLKEINKNISPESQQCNEKEIGVGAVVAAPYDNLYYRALILEEKSPLNEVRVRLIDYGNDFYINVAQLKSAIPLMKNLKAFAFCIRYKGKEIEIGEQLNIRIIGKENNEIYIAEEKTDDQNNGKVIHLQQIPKESKVLLMKIINNKNAIAVFNDSTASEELKKMNAILLNDNDKKFLCSKCPKKNDFIAGKIGDIWHRGYLLANWDKHFLLYYSDIGDVEIVTDIKMIPEEYKNIYSQAVILEIIKSHISEIDIKEKYFTIGSSLAVKQTDKDLSVYNLSCEQENLAEVKINSWNGCYETIGLESWLSIPGQKDLIKITCVQSHCKIYVCQESKYNYYSHVFNEIGRASKPTDVIVNKIVLAQYRNRYVRSKVLNQLEKAKDNVQVVNIDSGCTFDVSQDKIREANDFVRYSPVFTTKITLTYLNKIAPTPLSRAISVLETCIEKEETFSMNFDQNEKTTELLDEKMKSLNKQLIPLLFEQESKANDSKINSAPEQFLKMEDIELIPIPTKGKVKVIVLDNSMLCQDAVITVAVFNHGILQKYQTDYIEPVTKYCMDPSLPKEYSPRVNELCFSIYDADKQWYRAVCLDCYGGEKFLLFYIDYGNTTVAKKEKIRKMSKEFLYPSVANTCTLDGFTKPIPEELFKKLITVIDIDAVLTLDRVEKKDDSYLIHIDQIEKLIS